MGSLVSLVMTDIVGSTRRWAADEVAMADDLKVHDRLIRDVVVSAGGSVFKHTGDGMIAVFDDPVAAVGAAAAIQRAVGDTIWRHADGVQVRAAAHSGVVYERDGDMFGTAVNRVARILGVCPPGAVLVSNALAGLLVERAPEGFTVRPVGEVSLAGFSAPELVHIVSARGLVTVDSLAERVSGSRRGNELPGVDDELIGRHAELASISAALGRSRLVTLVGIGGMGKTRLALEAATGALDAFDGGVWWIDLAAATSDDAVIAVANEAVGAQETPGRSPLQMFCDRFRSKTALVVVDNCEHVVAAATELIDALRSSAPAARVLATSREALGVRGEHIVPIGSLPANEGLALFQERALAVRPSLDMEANRVAIEAVCSRLDGIPLAIELAAARCLSMDPSEIAARLDDRFRLLRGGRSGAERHRTLFAAVTWSYEMLDDQERHVFHHLAVFSDGSLIDGIADVCEMDEFDAIEVVERLIARSMVVPHSTHLGTRYRQLETLRQYAEDRMVGDGTIDTVRERHLAWVQRFALDFPKLRGTPQHAYGLRRMWVEAGNVRAAVQFAVASGRHHASHVIVAALHGSDASGDMLDWVRPLQLEAGWTADAATCAVAGVFFDLVRGRPADLTFGAVPMELVFTEPRVGSFYLLTRSLLPGGWREVLPIIDALEPKTDIKRVAIESLRFSVLSFRLNIGGEADQLDDTEFRAIRDRGLQALEIARRLGDEVMLSELLLVFGRAIERYAPDEALTYLREAVAVSELLGATTTRNRALAGVYLCLAATIHEGGADAATSAATLRGDILRALDEGAIGDALLLAASAAGIIGATDQAALLTLGAVWRRETGIDVNASMARFGIATTLSAEELEQQTAGVSLGAALDMVIAALARVIAAAEASDAGGGAS